MVGNKLPTIAKAIQLRYIQTISAKISKEIMTRLLVKQGTALRRVANVEIAKHDGSINLALVRSGLSSLGWHWDSTRSDLDTIEYSEPEERTQRITVHASGRVNYKVTPNPGISYIPCLLDLTEPVLIVAYVIPAVDQLDLIESTKTNDHVVELQGVTEGSLGFEFSAIPFDISPLAGEIWRFIIEGRYGLVCTIFPGSQFPVICGVPPEAFTLIRPSSPLPQQSIPEDQAFIRFQELMHANQVRQALVSSTIPEPEHGRIIDDVVRAGRGIQGPNKEGIWEVVCSVPMRIRPGLVVNFKDSRYRAELIDMTPLDKRLEKVRVRFKVYDQQQRRWIKHSVEITQAFLDARL
jgi:hypothetical protein